ncbi:MAG: ribosome-associated translation inhibitor RaiA [Chlamydiae bacterium]|nr:ribosome-associated translation inhibitor RaiA [Chlamydiota bacterium]MBI3267058.1 ribosome-associated translation inhibitor RaiA [Chlamydiota bacterium]
MDITFTSRHQEVSKMAKSYLVEKLERISKNIPKVTGAHAIFDSERYQHKVEVVILVHHTRIRAAEKTEDVMASIDKVMDKLQRQLKKYKDKLQFHRTKEKEFETSSGDGDEMDEEENEPHLVRARKFATKPMSSEEAMAQLKLSDDVFLVFLNAQSESVNVVYKKKDGNFGLIEPRVGKVKI